MDECLVPPGGVGAVHRAGVSRTDHRPMIYSKRPARGARPTVADRRGGVGPRAGRGPPAPRTIIQPGAEPADPVRRHRKVGPADRSARRLCPPTAGASTQEPWLQTEIHVTRRKTAPTLEGSPSMPRHGRVVAYEPTLTQI